MRFIVSFYSCYTEGWLSCQVLVLSDSESHFTVIALKFKLVGFMSDSTKFTWNLSLVWYLLTHFQSLS